MGEMAEREFMDSYESLKRMVTDAQETMLTGRVRICPETGCRKRECSCEACSAGKNATPGETVRRSA